MPGCRWPRSEAARVRDAGVRAAAPSHRAYGACTTGPGAHPWEYLRSPARCQGPPIVRGRGQAPGTVAHHQRVDGDRAVRRGDHRVEVHLEDRRDPRTRTAARPRHEPQRRRRGRRRPGRGCPAGARRRGAARGAGGPRRPGPAPGAPRRRRAPRRGPRPGRRAPTGPNTGSRRAADDQLDAGGRHRLHEQPAQRDAGPGGGRARAPRPPSRIAGSSARPSATPPASDLVREAPDVELEGDRPAAELPPGRDGRVRHRRAPRATSSPGGRRRASSAEALALAEDARGRGRARPPRPPAGRASSSAPQVTCARRRAPASPRAAARRRRARPAAPPSRPAGRSRRTPRRRPRSIGIPPAASSVALTCSLTSPEVSETYTGSRIPGRPAGRLDQRGAHGLAPPGPRSAGRGTASRGRSPARRRRRRPRSPRRRRGRPATPRRRPTGPAGCRCSPSWAGPRGSPSRAASGTGGRSMPVRGARSATSDASPVDTVTTPVRPRPTAAPSRPVPGDQLGLLEQLVEVVAHG